jgi:flagellar biosynthesis protein FliP
MAKPDDAELARSAPVAPFADKLAPCCAPPEKPEHASPGSSWCCSWRLSWRGPHRGLPAFTSTPAPAGSTNYSFNIEALLLLTSLTFLPAILLMMTSFTRIVIVFSLLRQALGTMQTPPIR